MELYQSSQDYLETILVLNNRTGNVRSIDIARELNVTKQSVYRAVKNLNEANYISIDDKGFITLTDKGNTVAKEMYERHVVLSGFFEKIGVSSEIAKEDACNVEHYISAETFAAIKKLCEKLK